jgi:hypothetical protein
VVILLICSTFFLGLKAHDLLTYTPEVKEAIKRMEPKDAEERYRRTRIAIDLSMKRDVLYENAPGEFENEYYLTELLAEVEAESKARRDFRNQS